MRSDDCASTIRAYLTTLEVEIWSAMQLLLLAILWRSCAPVVVVVVVVVVVAAVTCEAFDTSGRLLA